MSVKQFVNKNVKKKKALIARPRPVEQKDNTTNKKELPSARGSRSAPIVESNVNRGEYDKAMQIMGLSPEMEVLQIGHQDDVGEINQAIEQRNQMRSDIAGAILNGWKVSESLTGEKTSNYDTMTPVTQKILTSPDGKSTIPLETNEQARGRVPRKTYDPINNDLNWLMFEAIAGGRALSTGGLRWFAPGNTGGKFIGYMAAGEGLNEAGNEIHYAVSGSNNGYMPDGYNFMFNGHYDPYTYGAFQFLNPAFWFNPEGVARMSFKPIYNGVKSGINSGYDWMRTNIGTPGSRLSYSLNKSVKNFDTVGPEYFNSPNNWYRRSQSPEIESLKELGYGITTKDLQPGMSTINDWRTFVVDNKLYPGTGENEGYWFYPGKNKFSLGKTGSAHGNKIQAAKGKIWGKTSAGYKFPDYILEGEATPYIYRGFNPETGTDSRSTFFKVPWESVPMGARVGFNTKELPMGGLRAFRKLPNGRYQYEGEVIPNKVLHYDPDREINLFSRTGNKYIITSPNDRLLYLGPQRSISEIVNPDGTVNISEAMKFQREHADMWKGLRMENRNENSRWHKTDPNTFLHTKEAAQFAWKMPLPPGVSRQDLMVSALGHDFGKMFAGEGHGPIGADYLRQVFYDLTPEQYLAIRDHMIPVEDISSRLGLATKRADINTKLRSSKKLAPFRRMYERPSTLTDAEKAGIPKGERNNRQFKSELDWSPEGWLSQRPNGIYDQADVDALAKHVPEYLEIEQRAKADGTWLKMPDGSTWTEDPRSWVQMQSQAFKQYGGGPVLYHGSPTNKIAVFRTPSDLNATKGRFKATGEEGIYFSPSITGASRYTANFGKKDPTDIPTIYPVTTNAKLINVDDPLYPDVNFMTISTQDRKLIEKMGYQGIEYTANQPKNSETVIFDPARIKSLLGNNGNFSLNYLNMFKILPFVIGTGAYLYNQ